MSANERAIPEDNSLKNSINENEKASEAETTFAIVQQAVLQLWNVVNGLSSIQPPKRQHYRVTVFGSARIQKDTPLYDDVRWLASELTAMGCDIVTGGGPGLMEAANEGSVLADPSDRFESIGLRVNLSYEQQTNPFVEEVYQHRTFFSRLHHFVLLSDAFVVLPGGIGTTLEAMMIWQLLQVRHLSNTPLIMVGKMWFDLVDWATKHMVDREPKLANAVDMMIPNCVDTVAEAIALLRQSHAEWESCQSKECLTIFKPH
ncbi:MAG: LOG family protein [Hydrococcus sp. C42_A2020_068]|uniref:LOG family protein n=1 Tax=Pleurocapsa sp. PCC 7327 TaxID=118163 RepID=UPI0002A0005E|nr:LOG family protein [Pleurocapsa sp. PCC 7327]AFY76842.1 putative Rossmann fold nucleotide-binding protein [Pleurocapsa sp. PCC 7327]MBF2020871.1 LOG family protein [Hydrococcus sp. C42_A2020_068]